MRPSLLYPGVPQDPYYHFAGVPEDATRAAGDAAGDYAATAVGTAVGGAIGSVLGPFGTLIGSGAGFLVSKTIGAFVDWLIGLGKTAPESFGKYLLMTHPALYQKLAADHPLALRAYDTDPLILIPEPYRTQFRLNLARHIHRDVLSPLQAMNQLRAIQAQNASRNQFAGIGDVFDEAVDTYLSGWRAWQYGPRYFDSQPYWLRRAGVEDPPYDESRE